MTFFHVTKCDGSESHSLATWDNFMNLLSSAVSFLRDLTNEACPKPHCSVTVEAASSLKRDAEECEVPLIRAHHA